MEFISKAAEAFIGLFEAGAATFSSWVFGSLSLPDAGKYPDLPKWLSEVKWNLGIIPKVICLMVFVNSIIKLIGTERVERFARKITRFAILRYTLLPIIAAFFLANPMCYTFGRFVEEKHKPAFYDACVSFVHPITGLFPHANGGELFVYLGIAQGLERAGYSIGGLAIRYFIVGVIVILIRGLLTERIYAFMTRGNTSK